MQIKVISQLIILVFCVFVLPLIPAKAEQNDTPLCFSPIIIVDASPDQGNTKTLLIQPYTEALLITEESPLNHYNQTKLRIDDLDEYSLALGATFHINDQFNIGAACGVPLTNEETIQVEDISIEAMVTMQF